MTPEERQQWRSDRRLEHEVDAERAEKFAAPVKPLSRRERQRIAREEREAEKDRREAAEKGSG